MKLMSVNNACKKFTRFLTTMSFTQKILILSEYHSPQFSGSIQQVRIIHLCGAVFLRGQHIHSAQAQTFRNRRTHVNIKIESHAHCANSLSLSLSLSLRRNGESLACSAISAAQLA